MPQITQWLGTTPRRLRTQLQNDDSPEMRLRRTVVAANLIGIGAMTLTTLLQSGIVRQLPDPPIGNFKTKKVNSSDEAYSYGGPDSPINIAAHALNIILATTGGPNRTHKHPWLPLLAASVAAPQAAVAAKYLFYQMPYVDRAWCPYCILDALMHFANLALTLPEAKKAAMFTGARPARRRRQSADATVRATGNGRRRSARRERRRRRTA
jgi:uncharacterized membrane protein